MDGDRITRELMTLSKEHPEFDLLQFRTLVSARQYKPLYELIARYVPRASRVLDWGCGNGHASYALNALGHDVVGYTLERAPPIAQKLPRVAFTAGDGTGPRKLPFPDASFDAALSVGVLEHVRETGGDEVASLRELRRVLKPGGVFLCYHFPNRYSYIEALARFLPGAHHHAYRFTKAEVRSICASARFDVVESARYGALPRNPWQSMSLGVANSHWFADLWDGLDSVGKYIAPAVLQNHYFVARAR